MAAAGSWLLTLDRGNSTLDCMLRAASATERVSLAAPDPADVAGFLAGRRPHRAVGLTVVPGGLEPAARALADLGVPLLVAGRDLACPLQLDYRAPETLGVDRWVAAYAAHRQFGAACIVDLGTAVTVDLVDEGGVYRGGAIAPGLAAIREGLAAGAPELPVAEAEEEFAVPPDASRPAVAMGVQVGFCGMVERLVHDLVGAATWPVVLTGGGAGSYLRHGRLRVEHVPDLVHRGLALLVDEPCAS